MTGIPLSHYVIFSMLLFSIGLYGVLVRRHVIGILMSIEIMLNAANINLVAFSNHVAFKPEAGQVFALFVILLATCEAAIALAIVLAIYRNKKTVHVDNLNLLKW